MSPHYNTHMATAKQLKARAEFARCAKKAGGKIAKGSKLGTCGKPKQHKKAKSPCAKKAKRVHPKKRRAHKKACALDKMMEKK